LLIAWALRENARPAAAPAVTSTHLPVAPPPILLPTETPTVTPSPTATPFPGIREMLTEQARDILARAADLQVRANGEGDGEVVDSEGRVVRQIYCADVESRIADGSALVITPLLILLHWDSMSEEVENPTTDLTINGLGAGKSVHFCVDPRPHDEGGVTQSARIPMDESGQVMAYNGDHAMAVVSNANVMTYLSDWAAACEGGPFLLPELDELAHNSWDKPVNDLSVGIESTGHHYAFASLPPNQQTANMLAAAVMLMKTYRVPLYYLVGHHDLQEGKPDVGNEYAALMRLLVLLYALDRGDSTLLDLIPVRRDNDPRAVVADYLGGPFGRFTQARLGDDGLEALMALVFCDGELEYCG